MCSRCRWRRYSPTEPNPRRAAACSISVRSRAVICTAASAVFEFPVRPMWATLHCFYAASLLLRVFFADAGRRKSAHCTQTTRAGSTLPAPPRRAEVSRTGGRWRTLDSAERLLKSIEAPQADEVGRVRHELRSGPAPLYPSLPPPSVVPSLMATPPIRHSARSSS